jgi:formylmethanofuran dehydrogenase subunit E
MVNMDEREEHVKTGCDKRPISSVAVEDQNIEKAPAANAANWKCDKCGEAFIMTPVEKLKHKRGCK